MFEHYSDGEWHVGAKTDCPQCDTPVRKAPVFIRPK